MTEKYLNLWAQCCRYIKDNITPQLYDTWFRDIVCESYDDAKLELVLKVPSSFFADMIEARFLSVLRSAVKKNFGEARLKLSYLK